MATKKLKNAKEARRRRVKYGIRRKVSGTVHRPRMTVFRSNKNIYAQLIDDLAGHTLVAASSLEQDLEGGSPVEIGKAVGERLATRAREAGLTEVVFDRNGYRYQGRVKALAEGARKGGLQF